jgi:hypothetical protein
VFGPGWYCGGGVCCEEAGTVQHINAASVTAAKREAKIIKVPLGIEKLAAALTGCQ